MRSRTLAAIAALAPLGLAAPSRAADAVRYQVTFERTWSAETHPKDFPLLAHFSPVIGATHSDGWTFLPQGGTATPGVERLCEEGKHQPLDEEIRAAVADGRAGTLIETPDPIRSAPASAVTTFDADPAHPMVTIAAMIAPSPDWCAVAARVPLREGGAWVAEKKVTLYAWDMGTDSATSYRALDDDTQPRGPIQASDSPYFVKGGAPTPVGTVTFVRQ